MTAVCSLGPVAVGVMAALNVPAVIAMAPGGVWDQIPRAVGNISVRFELQEQDQLGGLSADDGAVVELELRVHVYSGYEGFKEARAAMNAVMGQLTGALTLAGFREIGRPSHQDTVPLPDQVVAGVRVNELVGRWQIFVEKV